MIILDTHVWIWHVRGDPKLPDNYRNIIEASEALGLGVFDFIVGNRKSR